MVFTLIIMVIILLVLIPVGIVVDKKIEAYFENKREPLPVTEVALQSGFPNVSHFIRCFHRTYQMSPLQYRKQLPYQ